VVHASPVGSVNRWEAFQARRSGRHVRAAAKNIVLMMMLPPVHHLHTSPNLALCACNAMDTLDSVFSLCHCHTNLLCIEETNTLDSQSIQVT
jgi:hypothetical protein